MQRRQDAKRREKIRNSRKRSQGTQRNNKPQIDADLRRYLPYLRKSAFICGLSASLCAFASLREIFLFSALFLQPSAYQLPGDRVQVRETRGKAGQHIASLFNAEPAYIGQFAANYNLGCDGLSKKP
jgi:hypothetical protein